LTSGGAGGQAVPTSADDVFFDAVSGAVTCTVSAAANCFNLDCTGFTGTLTGTSQINTFGSVLLVPGMTLGSGLNWSFRAASGSWSLTSAAKTMGSVTFGGIASTGTWSLLDALTSSSSVTVTYGTFNTNNYNVTATSLSSNNNNTRTINLGSSTVTLSATSPIAFTTNTNLTFNAGTSSIIVTNASGNIAPGATGVTFYNVSWTNTAISLASVQGACTFNNLSVTGRTSAGVANLRIDANQTINGTLTLSAGTNATMRTFVRSDTIGTTRTLTCAAVASLTDIDFLDITIAGAAAPVSGTRLGDCKGNSGITFDAAKTVYWRGGTGTFGAANWSDISGGSTNTIYFPLAQDTAIFNDANVTTGATATVNAGFNLGTINMSGLVSNTMTLATGTTTPAIYGNWINGTGTTLTGTGLLTFAGRGSQTITSAGKTFTQSFTIDTPGGSVTLQDAFVSNRSASSAFTLTSGTFDANGYNFSLTGAISRFSSLGTNAKTMAVGSGSWTIAGSSTSWNIGSAVYLTVTGTGTISFTSASAKSFEGGNVQTYPTLNQGGTGTLTVNGSNKFAGLTNTAIGRIQFQGGQTNEFTSFTISGALGNLLQLGSTNTTQAILQKPTAWNMGVLSMDMGNNTGLNFLSNDGTMEYLSVSYINGTVVAPFISVFIIESATSADAQSSLATLNIGVSESITAADAQAAGFICLGTLSESATVADAVEAFRASLALVVESATSSELVNAALTLSATISEITTGADQLAARTVLNSSLSELATIADSAAGGLLFLSNISEATTAQELATALGAFNRAILEAAAVQDSSAVAASTFSAASAETATLLDAPQGANTGSSSLSESATVSEAQAAQFTAATTISEASTAQESQVAVFVAATQVAEVATPSDSILVAPSTFGAIALAAAQAAESFSPAGSVYNAALPVESAGITDFLLGAYLWNPIDDTQTPNWQNISSGQNPAWTQVLDTQSPEWQSLNNAQTPNWGQVPNGQTPVWVVIPTSKD
jgi:hypothetical protein